jgi:hypothetical protein
MVFVTELRVVTCFCVIKQIVYAVVVNKKFTKDEDGNIIPLFLDIRIAFIANSLYTQYSPCPYGRVIASHISWLAFDARLFWEIHLRKLIQRLGTPASSTNKTDHPGITEMLLKAALNAISQPYLQHILIDIHILPWDRHINIAVRIYRNILYIYDHRSVHSVSIKYNLLVQMKWSRHVTTKPLNLIGIWWWQSILVCLVVSLKLVPVVFHPQ